MFENKYIPRLLEVKHLLTIWPCTVVWLLLQHEVMTNKCLPLCCSLHEHSLQTWQLKTFFFCTKFFFLRILQVFQLLDSNLLGQQCSFVTLKMHFFLMCCSLKFAKGAIALLLMVQEMHIELDFLFIVVYWQSTKRKMRCA